jgi:23S rRNA (cytidine1920-2'-O)/16S rRNA (cytidine1409-2'-O)-methyltransferase
VVVGGIAAQKPTTQVSHETAIALADAGHPFVSRGGDKLDGALDRFAIGVSGRTWLDAGASTGGFTDVLLRRGASRVIAVDVGYGQLAWSLRTDGRVTVLERTNVRDLRRADLPFPVEALAADLSFISLRLALPALDDAAPEATDFVVLVKPQFEVGRGAVGPGGVVRDPAQWRAALESVTDVARDRGMGVADAAAALPPGPAGNREFFLWLRRGGRHDAGASERAVAEAS